MPDRAAYPIFGIGGPFFIGGSMFALFAILLQTTVYEPITPLGLVAYAAFTAISGWLGNKAYDGIKTIWPWWDSRPSLWHQIAAPVFQFVFGAIGAATGTKALMDEHSITAGWIGGILTVLVAGGIKRWEKSREPVDATAVLELSRKQAPVVTPVVGKPIP